MMHGLKAIRSVRVTRFYFGRVMEIQNNSYGYLLLLLFIFLLLPVVEQVSMEGKGMYIIMLSVSAIVYICEGFK